MNLDWEWHAAREHLMSLLTQATFHLEGFLGIYRDLYDTRSFI